MTLSSNILDPTQAVAGTTTVLVIEDDLEINELLGEYLALENIRYLQATTGKAGIHQALTQHPDAIVLDLMLPDIDGFEVARTLTARRATHNIPIIILSCMCQECDREKGFSSGALFFMNKPFLPDDLLVTLRKALDWKRTLASRTPAGAIAMGLNDVAACSQGINAMVTDIFARTELSDASVVQIREAVETLGAWAQQWNREHPEKSTLTLDYRITPSNGQPATIEWQLTENLPGLLADAFFKPASGAATGASTSSGGGVGAGVAALGGSIAAGIGGALMGWGGAGKAGPIAPPARWLQVLAKTGAARFEKDSRNKTVRFARSGAPTAGSPSAQPASNTVPVVEIDGTRIPNRLRDEALAAKGR